MNRHESDAAHTVRHDPLVPERLQPRPAWRTPSARNTLVEDDDYIEVSVNYTVPIVAKVRLYRDPTEDEVWSVHVADEAIALDPNDPPSVWVDPTIEQRAQDALADRAVGVAESSEWPSWEFGF